MNTHTHTPGPWQNQRNHSGRVISKKTQRDFETNETKMLCFIVRNEDYFPVEESDANARLIASAPDLLAALREIESKLTALLCERVLDSTLPEFYEVRDARNSARAAIAKAEGVK
jgi:hypothetical protein